jgi:hypothetical protein
MSNSALDINQVITRLAGSLEHSVLPYIDNHYAQLQVRAAREMLLNLGSRVEWRQADIEASERVLLDALSELAALGLSDYALAPLDPVKPSHDLVALRDILAGVIEKVYDTSLSEIQREKALAAIWQVIRIEFDAEAARIKTGMYS